LWLRLEADTNDIQGRDWHLVSTRIVTRWFYAPSSEVRTLPVVADNIRCPTEISEMGGSSRSSTTAVEGAVAIAWAVLEKGAIGVWS
jgi:hypothetical protein